ncbi:MAG: hypothetical protein P1U36_07590 [Legionellaceae bacterium]|nr:hypothetical protein [Legionellaceae bacterium]
MNQGYYIFLGAGDYHFPDNITKEWACTWSLEDWKSFIGKLVAYDVDTLMIYLNGHSLPYQSLEFPFLVDNNHPNVKKEFLSEVFEFIKGVGIKVIAVITTTGHSGHYADLYPASKIEGLGTASGKEGGLISFPEKMRLGKTSKKSGSAQLGYGVLCHNKESTRLFTESLIREILSMYGQFFYGVALHPPETISPCLCDKCSELFFNKRGCDLADATFEEQRKFFTLSYLNYQNSSLFPIVKSHLPSANTYTFTIPWLFENHFNEVILFIDRDTSIIEWDYNLSDERISSLTQRIEMYQSRGNSVWFMPSSGFSFNEDEDIPEQIRSVHLQIRLAMDACVDGVSYFLGPKLSCYFDETSMKNLDDPMLNRISP